MAQSQTTLSTTNASRYLQQLCKHFGHKVPVEFTPTEGYVALPFGDCRMSADDGALNLVVEGDATSLRQLERFIGDHLIRFAFRENPTLTWNATT